VVKGAGFIIYDGLWYIAFITMREHVKDFARD